MLPWTGTLAGRLDELVIDSQALRGNPVGDPHERPLWVYAPPGYDDDPTARYPTVYVIQGYTGHVAMWANRAPFRQPFPFTDVPPFIKMVYEAFGPKRMMWGSNYPPSSPLEGYANTRYYLIKHLSDFCSKADMEWIFSKTALSLFRFGGKKS